MDDDASTRYSSGTGQEPGQYLQVDFGRVQPIRQVVFDTGASTGDYPRGYAVTASAENRSFVDIAPRAGQLLLWESWLRHGVEPNQARTPRISVSFHYGTL